MRLLLDTQILVWLVTGDRRLKAAWRTALSDADTSLCVSAVIASEYTDLQVRGRLPVDESIAVLVERFDLSLEAYPGEAWSLLPTLPEIHRDPVDRMLVAHALLGDFTIMTADANIRRYPVPCI